MMKMVRFFGALLALMLLSASPAAAVQGLLGIYGYGIGTAATKYSPSAVTFTPETTYGIYNGSLNANGGVDTPHMIISWWERAALGTNASMGAGNAFSSYILDIFGNGRTAGGCNSESCPGAIYVVDNANSALTVRMNFNDSVGGVNHQVYGLCNGCAAPWTDVWHHYLIVEDSSGSYNNEAGGMYVDGVKQAGYGVAAQGASTGAFNINLNSPVGWAFSNHVDSGANTGAYDIADFFMDTGANWTTLASSLGCTAIVDTSNNVCPALVAKFYNAGPVDIGGATDCSKPLGRQPELCFSGDKGTGTTGGFLVNKGNATATLALFNNANGTNSGIGTPQIYNASFGPSGPPVGRPYFVWQRGGYTASTTALTIAPNGAEVRVGDLLIIFADIADNTNLTRSMTAPSGWTAVPVTSGPANPLQSGTSRYMTYGTFYKIADATDVNPTGTYGPAYTVGYANAGAARTARITMVNYRGANATNPIAGFAGASYANNIASSYVAPSLTSPSANAVLATVLMTYSSGYAIYPPASQDLRVKANNPTTSAAPANAMWSDEAITATGATGTRTVTSGGADTAFVANVLIVP